MSIYRYYDLDKEPEADILPASLQSTLPDSNTLEGKREKDLLVFARLAIWEFGPDSELEPEVAEKWGNVPNNQHLIVAGEMDATYGYRPSAIELSRDFGPDDPCGKIITLKRVAYSYSAYDEIVGRYLPYLRDLNWRVRTLREVIQEIQSSGLTIVDVQKE